MARDVLEDMAPDSLEFPPSLKTIMVKYSVDNQAVAER